MSLRTRSNHLELVRRSVHVTYSRGTIVAALARMSVKSNGNGRTHRDTTHHRVHGRRPTLPKEQTPTIPTDPSLRRSAFPPIAEYAFLSDCEVSALVAPNGNVEWMCIPRHDGPSIFASMLDRDAGSFRIGPVGLAVPMRREYVPGSLVVESVWQTRTGWLVVKDALCMTPWRHSTRASRFRRAPPDWEAASMFVRTVECTYGHVEVELECSPMFNYGATAPEWRYAGEGYGAAEAFAEQHPKLLLATDLHLGLEPRSARARTLLEKGSKAFVALAWGDLEPPRSYADACALVDGTVTYWQRWLDRGVFPDHPWRSYLQRSALTIKGLTYAPTGAVMAAPTTSLPETPGGSRNWDYRFSWLRDSVYTLRTLARLGYETEARDYTLFLREVVQPGEALQIMYGIGGEKNLIERELPHLHGYDGARPVRVGNGAFDQKQHDIWGNLIGLLAFESRRLGRVPDQMWKTVREVVAAMREHWREPDRGIWEVRGEPRHFVSSKLMCWYTASTAAELARMVEDEAFAADADALAKEIRADILEHGLDRRGVFTQYYGSRGLDASNLLMASLQFLPPDDPRMRKTVLAIADELTIDGLALRYRVDNTDDGLEGEEGTFCICSFWLVSALVYIGELHRARRLCEKLLAFASPMFLYAEEIDARSGRHLGNFPQAFSHLSMTDALAELIEAEARAKQG